MIRAKCINMYKLFFTKQILHLYFTQKGLRFSYRAQNAVYDINIGKIKSTLCTNAIPPITTQTKEE